MSDTAVAITVAWLHSLKEPGWKPCTRGIEFANWTIHSIVNAPFHERIPHPEDAYDLGPFVWTVAPTHGANMVPLEKPGNSNYVILVLESQRDVIRLLRLLRREAADAQSYADLVASGGIVDAP